MIINGLDLDEKENEEIMSMLEDLSDDTDDVLESTQNVAQIQNIARVQKITRTENVAQTQKTNQKQNVTRTQKANQVQSATRTQKGETIHTIMEEISTNSDNINNIILEIKELDNTEASLEKKIASLKEKTKKGLSSFTAEKSQKITTIHEMIAQTEQKIQELESVRETRKNKKQELEQLKEKEKQLKIKANEFVERM